MDLMEIAGFTLVAALFVMTPGPNGVLIAQNGADLGYGGGVLEHRRLFFPPITCTVRFRLWE